MRYNIMDLRGTLLDNLHSDLPGLDFSILKFFQTRKSIPFTKLMIQISKKPLLILCNPTPKISMAWTL
jgi:hypothetical protein